MAARGRARPRPVLESAFWRRLAHRPARWGSASVERLSAVETVRVPAGSFRTTRYVVRTEDGREGTFDIEVADPHRVVRWAWSPPAGVDAKRSTSVGWTAASSRGRRDCRTGSCTTRATSGIWTRWGSRRFVDAQGATITRRVIEPRGVDKRRK